MAAKKKNKAAFGPIAKAAAGPAMKAGFHR